MIDREKFNWRVTLANTETGAQGDIELGAYWSPEKEGTAEAIGIAAAAQVSAQTHKRHVPLSVVQI